MHLTQVALVTTLVVSHISAAPMPLSHPHSDNDAKDELDEVTHLEPRMGNNPELWDTLQKINRLGPDWYAAEGAKDAERKAKAKQETHDRLVKENAERKARKSKNREEEDRKAKEKELAEKKRQTEKKHKDFQMAERKKREKKQRAARWKKLLEEEADEREEHEKEMQKKEKANQDHPVVTGSAVIVANQTQVHDVTGAPLESRSEEIYAHHTHHRHTTATPSVEATFQETHNPVSSLVARAGTDNKGNRVQPPSGLSIAGSAATAGLIGGAKAILGMIPLPWKGKGKGT